MNPVLAPLFARRSVRQFQNRPVADALIRDALEAAMAAPSANARDPWEILVIRDAETRARIATGLPSGKMLADAPVGFVICGDLTRAHGRQLSYLLQDCSACIENLLLALAMLGLGGVWLGVHPREERGAHLREIFGLPDAVVPVGVVAAGYPVETPPPRTRFAEQRIHRDRW